MADSVNWMLLKAPLSCSHLQVRISLDDFVENYEHHLSNFMLTLTPDSVGLHIGIPRYKTIWLICVAILQTKNTDDILALQISKMHMNILLIPKIHRWSRQLVSTWRSSRGWCLPPRPPPLLRAPLSFQAWLAFAGGTSQHHQRIRCLPLRGRSQHHQPILGVCNLYLIMVCALIQLCMLAIPSIIPLGKRDLEDFAFESLFGDPKKDSVFHLDIVVASDWLFAFLRRHLDVFLVLWRDYFHAKYLLLIFRKIQKL